VDWALLGVRDFGQSIGRVRNFQYTVPMWEIQRLGRLLGLSSVSLILLVRWHFDGISHPGKFTFAKGLCR
jgi:hypothetical protein